MINSIITTFILVFLAELGDKTQLSTMLLAAKSDSILPIFIGSSVALVTSSLLGVFAGCILNKYIPMTYIQYFSGAAFIIIGILLLTGKV